MKNIKIEEGIKASLGDLINKVQSITNENQSELAVQLFTPGFFVKKLPTGALEADWETSILDLSPTDLIRINTRGRNPAFCYTAGGKILSLKETTSLDPRDIEGYYHYNTPTTINNSNVVYELWAIPTISESEPVDYLPNYKQTGEIKYLVDNYLAGFLLIKKGSTPPIINNETDSRPGGSAPIRQVFNTVEGIKLAEFTYRESTLNISNLIDFRLQNRAYLRPELYDFFNEAYLKHDFLLTHAEDSAGNNVLSFNKNGVNPPTLSGTFSLVSSKERIVSGGNTYVSKIKVTASNVPVPVNSVLAITVTPADYVSATNLTKTLEVIPLNDYTPHVDKILIGYHLRTFLDNGIPVEDNTGSTDVIENLGIGGSTPTPVNQQISVIYFVNGLPPLPPGQNISRSGIGSYVLTKDEAAEAYYNKTKSDLRFIKSGNDSNTYEQVSHKNDIYHSIDGSTRTGQAYTGVKFTNATIPVGLYAGYAWLNHENNTLGYIHRGVNSGDNGYIELGVFKNDGSELRAFRLEDGFLKAIGPNEYPGNTPADGNKLVTVAYGLLNRGDDAKGNYNWRIGKFVFYQPSETYAPDSSGPINSENIPESSTVKVLQFNFDNTNSVVIDLLDHRISGSLAPREGGEGAKDLVPRDWAISKINDSVINIINQYGEFDCIVKTLSSVINGIYEFHSVRDAILAGKKRIKIADGIYNMNDYSTGGDAPLPGFWPTQNDVVPNTGITITGENTTTINGLTYFLSTSHIINIKFKNIRFEVPSGTTGNLVKLGNVADNKYASNITFERCTFKGYCFPDTTLSIGTIGINISTFKDINEKEILVLDNCYFENNLMGIGINNGSIDSLNENVSSIKKFIKIINSTFYNNIIGIVPVFVHNFLIENCNFLETNDTRHSFIAFAGLTTTGSNANVQTIGFKRFIDTHTTGNISIIITKNKFFCNSTIQTEIYFKIEKHNSTDYCTSRRVTISNNHFISLANDFTSISYNKSPDGPPPAYHYFRIILFNNYFTNFNFTDSPTNDNDAGINYVSFGSDNEATINDYVLHVYGGTTNLAILTDNEIKISNFIERT